MTKFFCRHFVLLFYMFLVFAPDAVDSNAEEVDYPLVLQLMVGKMVISNDDPQVSGGDYDITLFGVAAQKPFGGNLFKYGVEIGALFNWQSETRAYAASGGVCGGALAISVDIQSFIFDYFFGGYVSFEPVKWLRLYIGAGPLIIYGTRETEPDDPDTQEIETKSESGLSAGVYGRTGLDLIFAEKVILSAGIRGTKTRKKNSKDSTITSKTTVKVSMPSKEFPIQRSGNLFKTPAP